MQPFPQIFTYCHANKDSVNSCSDSYTSSERVSVQVEGIKRYGNGLHHHHHHHKYASGMGDWEKQDLTFWGVLLAALKCVGDTTASPRFCFLKYVQVAEEYIRCPCTTVIYCFVMWVPDKSFLVPMLVEKDCTKLHVHLNKSYIPSLLCHLLNCDFFF